MHLYGLIIGIAILIGINYFEKHQNLIPKNKLTIFELGTIISAIIGARIYHILDYWQFYSQNPALIYQIWNGGLGIFGAIIGSIIFIYFFSLFSNFKFQILNLFDSITPILPLCQAIGRLGNWVNRENPLWWSEAILNLILFFILKFFPKNPTAKYLIGYGTIRLLTEFWRTDTWTVGNIKIAQIIAVIFIIAGLILNGYERSKVTGRHR